MASAFAGVQQVITLPATASQTDFGLGCMPIGNQFLMGLLGQPLCEELLPLVTAAAAPPKHIAMLVNSSQWRCGIDNHAGGLLLC